MDYLLHCKVPVDVHDDLELDSTYGHVVALDRWGGGVYWEQLDVDRIRIIYPISSAVSSHIPISTAHEGSEYSLIGIMHSQ